MTVNLRPHFLFLHFNVIVMNRHDQYLISNH
jgi:hypothetical protein